MSRFFYTRKKITEFFIGDNKSLGYKNKTTESKIQKFPKNFRKTIGQSQKKLHP